ncbi:HipB Predicted transcriptional regulators [Spirosomataceae bacterium]|jgi:transcriptional regulator with XRE-family HTH domain
MENIDTKLRALRKLHNYKQDYLGDYLGIGQSSYSRLENGKPDNIKLGHILKLGELYNVTSEQIMGWDGKLNFGTVNNQQGVVVNQGTTHLNGISEERIKNLEEKIEQLMSVVGRG